MIDLQYLCIVNCSFSIRAIYFLSFPCSHYTTFQTSLIETDKSLFFSSFLALFMQIFTNLVVMICKLVRQRSTWYRKSHAFYFGSSDLKYTFRFTIYTNNFLYQSLIDYQQGQHILIVLQPWTIKSNPRGILFFIQGKSDVFHQ